MEKVENKREDKIENKIENENAKNMNLPKQKKNHWTQSRVDEATKKINREVYEKNRQAPLQIKLDDFVILINDKITRRGIAKGLISIQEDLNMNILEVQKLILEAYLSTDKKNQYEKLMHVIQILKIAVWSDIRFLMINKAITPGEITELIRRHTDVIADINRWMTSISKAISAL